MKMTKTAHTEGRPKSWLARFDNAVMAGGRALHEPRIALNQANAPGYGRENYTVSHPPPLVTVDAFAAGSSYCGTSGAHIFQGSG